jgi:hypothetical protein
MLGKFVAEMIEEHGWTEADLEAAAKEARARAITYDPETGTWQRAEV